MKHPLEDPKHNPQHAEFDPFSIPMPLVKPGIDVKTVCRAAPGLSWSACAACSSSFRKGRCHRACCSWVSHIAERWCCRGHLRQAFDSLDTDGDGTVRGEGTRLPPPASLCATVAIVAADACRCRCALMRAEGVCLPSPSCRRPVWRLAARVVAVPCVAGPRSLLSLLSTVPHSAHRCRLLRARLRPAPKLVASLSFLVPCC